MRAMEWEAGTSKAVWTLQGGDVHLADRGIRIASGIATGAFAAIMAISGVMFVIGPTQVVEGIGHLGYPRYFMALPGVAKLLGVGALLAPGARTLREWAYAGFAFVMIAAVLSHVLSGDAPAQAAPATFMRGLLLTSHGSRALEPAAAWPRTLQMARAQACRCAVGLLPHLETQWTSPAKRPVRNKDE